MGLGPRLVVELMGRLLVADAAFAAAIRSAVPIDLPIPEGRGEVCPADHGYQAVRDKFVDRVTDITSVKALQFLYAVDRYLAADFILFKKQYGFLLDNDRLIRIPTNLPRLDQTTICMCLPAHGSSSVETRLDDLERIGLVAWPAHKRPFPKLVGITPAGIHAIETAAEIADQQLVSFAEQKVAAAAPKKETETT